MGADGEIGKKVQEILATYFHYYESALRDAAAEGLRIADIPAKARDAVRLHGGRAQPGAHSATIPRSLQNLGKSAFRFLGIDGAAAA